MVALTKYLISASPGKPLSVGGNVFLTWPCGGGRAISIPLPDMFIEAIWLLSEAQALLNGNCRMLAGPETILQRLECLTLTEKGYSWFPGVSV